MSSKPKCAVLFDVDGTLIDSNYFHTIAWWLSFRQASHRVPMAEIHRSIGMGGDKLIGHLLGENLSEEDEQQLKNGHDAIFSTYWPQLVRFEGTKELLTQCHDSGACVVLASSAKQVELEVLRRALDADSVITAATSSSDADASKPAPDIVEAALNAAGVDAANTVFVGDAVWDVYAAGKLGIPVVALCSGGTSEAELREAGAVEVYKDAKDLLENLAASAVGQLIGHALKS